MIAQKKNKLKINNQLNNINIISNNQYKQKDNFKKDNKMNEINTNDNINKKDNYGNTHGYKDIIKNIEHLKHNKINTDPNLEKMKCKEKYEIKNNKQKNQCINIASSKSCSNEKQNNTEKGKELETNEIENEDNPDDISENDFIEGNILYENEFKNCELNEIILRFIKILYKDADKDLNNKNKREIRLYDSKIQQISNIIISMKYLDQIKVMESMNRTADSYNKMELFLKLSKKVDERNKLKRNKNYKSDSTHRNSFGGYSYKAKTSRFINK
jgi:hypothetical protein